MREASIAAGLAPETVSQIIRRGNASKPRPDTLEALAEALGGDYAYMMRLAGYPVAEQVGMDKVHRLGELARRVSRLPPDRQRRFMETFLALLDLEEDRDADVGEAEILRESAKGQ